MSELRINDDIRTEEARRRVDGGPEEHKATGVLWLKDQCLMGIYTGGEITFGAPNPRGWFYKLCTGAASTVLKICLGWCGANSLMVSGFYFLGDSLTILSTSEDSRSFMGGSDVVHCVRVPLTGTTVA